MVIMPFFPPDVKLFPLSGGRWQPKTVKSEVVDNPRQPPRTPVDVVRGPDRNITLEGAAMREGRLRLALGKAYKGSKVLTER
jgi:hypothetical protein